MHWSSQYLGLTYRPEFDCAALVERVLERSFGIRFCFPHRGPAADGDPYGGCAASARRQGRSMPLETGRDGDVILLREGGNAPGRVLHCGVFAAAGAALRPPQAPAVLHNSLTAGQVVLTPLSRLRTGLHRFEVLGLYRHWRLLA